MGEAVGVLAGFGEHDDALVAVFHAAADFGDGGVDAGLVGDDGEADVAVAGGYPILADVVVVGLNAGKLKLRVVFDEEIAGLAADVGKEDFCVDAVLVLGLEAGLGVVDKAGDFLPALRVSLAEGVSHGGGAVDGAAGFGELTVDEPALDGAVYGGNGSGGVGGFDHAGDTVAPSGLGHAASPGFGVLLGVAVAADESEFDFHVGPPGVMDSRPRLYGCRHYAGMAGKCGLMRV